MARNQGVFPPEPRENVQIESVNGVSRIQSGRVTNKSFDPDGRTETLPYRDTVTGRYRER